jgi:hypothetical protein
MGKGLLVAVVTVFAGFVGYKIIKKKNPELINKIKGSISNAGKKFSAVVDEARISFAEGYAHG